MSFTRATKESVYLRCALFGPSGSGKTMSALRMAKGISQRMGFPFAVIDTESKSASKYADRFAFDVDDLQEKTVESYLSAMAECAASGYKVLVIDSLSHAWRELTEEVDRLSQSNSGKNSFSAWARVSPKQKKLVDAILNFPGHVIATMRSRTEWVVSVGKNGKAVPEKMGLSPEQGKGIEYEFDLLLELNQNHEALVSKDRTGKFQDEVIAKPDESFGASLYDWLSAPVAEPKGKADVPVKEKTDETAFLRETGEHLIEEIANILTETVSGKACFSEIEKEAARKLIKTTRLDRTGIEELTSLRDSAAKDLASRKIKAAA